jgi:ATP-dependent DNA ligase
LRRKNPEQFGRVDGEAAVIGAGLALVAEGALVFAKACELGLEGIVSKRAGSRYSSGNSGQWLKSKNPEFERADAGEELVAFDLLNLNGEDFRQRPIEERRGALSPLIAGVHCILFSDALMAEGALVFAKACELGLEGIVSKRAGSRYSSGNSRQWLKSKNPAFARG